MTSISDRLARAKPRTEIVPVCLDGSLVNKHQEAVVALAAATASDDSLAIDPEVHACAQAVRDVEAEIEDATIRFKLGTVSREVWADLLAAFPPSKEERRAGHDHDPKRFPPAAVKACTLEPEDFTIEDAQAIAKSDSVPAGEFNKLWAVVFGLNVTGTPAPKLAAATELLRANALSSTTPPPAESPEDGSLAGSGEQ